MEDFFIRAHFLTVTGSLPAKAMVANMKQFNGKFGCSFCMDEGQTRPNCPVKRFRSFKEQSTLRTRQSYEDDVKEAVCVKNAMPVFSHRLLKIEIPDFVSRTPRSLEDHAHWKAKECREWLLHLSVPVLGGVLPPVVYVHYMLLVSAINLLNKEKGLMDEMSYAEILLLDFCRLFPELYGQLHQTKKCSSVETSASFRKIIWAPVYHILFWL